MSVRRVLRLPPSASVAVAGASVMAIELLLPRRLAPDVGTTSAVWTAGIAVVLTGLALGAALGGRGADEPGAERREARRLLLGALLACAAPFLARAAAAASPGGPALRALFGTVAGGLLPSLLLGAVYPVAAARALRTARRKGAALGRLAAAGAIGSVAGTWATSFGLIAHLPVTTGFYAVGGALALTALLRAGRDRDAVPPTPTSATATPPVHAVAAPGRPLSPRAAMLWNGWVGAATLALEVVAARRVALDAGSSLEAWTAVFVVVLLGLSLGGALGGFAADRTTPRRATAFALCVAALLAAGTLRTADAVVWARALPHGFAVRTAIGVAIAYLPLFVALGAVPPMLARAAVAGVPDPGRVAGQVSAVGTLGALVGVLAAGPLLLPALRLEGAAAALAAGLALSAAGLSARRAVPLVFAAGGVVLAALARADLPSLREAGLALGVRPDREGVWVEDGAYARVVIETAPEAGFYGRRVVRMKIDARTHGIHDLDDPAWIGSKYGTMYDAVARRLYGDRPHVTALFLGGGTYTAPRAILRRWPQARVHVAEIAPEVTRGAQARLGLGATPGLTFEHEDGRTVVRAGRPTWPDGRAPGYDLVFGDAFGDVGVPWHLTTMEFLEEVKAALAPDGVYLANTIDLLAHGRFVSAQWATLKRVFRHVQAVSVARETTIPWNFVFVASDRPFSLAGLGRTDPADPRGPGLPLHVWDPAELDAAERRDDAAPLRDDFAPVERLLAPLVERASPR